MKPGPLVLLTLLAVLHLPGAVAAENSIAFLGPKGSYSDQAASEYVSRADLAGTTPLDTITQIALSVRNGRVQYGLLPFENSIGGFVGETHRLLLASQDPGWHVIADVTISISNNLLVKPGTRPSDLRKIISHPEALRESANWLKANFPQLPQEGVSSTAATVRELRNRYTQLLKWLEAGEEISITRRGVVIARLVPENHAKARRGADWAKSAAFALDRLNLRPLTAKESAELLRFQPT